jgi:predicted Zn-dependent peptidase
MFCSLRRYYRLAALTVLIIGSGFIFACEKNTEEADKFPSSQTPTRLEGGELTSFQLKNGITVYLREEHSRPEIAVEVLYKAGLLDEYEGKIQISRLLPHMLIFSATKSYAENEAVEELKKHGQVNGDITGTFTQFDYIVAAGKLDLALDIEVERLTSVRFNEDQLKKYQKKCAEDLNTMMTKPSNSLKIPGLMAFNQAFYYGKTSIPVEAGIYQLTINDLERFHRDKFRPETMVVVVVGDFDTAETTSLIKQKLENITVEPAAKPRPKKPADSDCNAQWDIPAQVMILTFPGPYKDDRTRLALTLFGTFLNRELTISDELQLQLRSSFCSNHGYPVGDIPFFVFAEPRRGRNVMDVRTSLVLTIDAAMKKVTTGMFNAMKANMISFCESSMLNTPLSPGGISHYQIIGQEALFIGLRHYLREGRSPEEFIEFIRSITFEEAKEAVANTITMDNLKVVTITETP